MAEQTVDHGVDHGDLPEVPEANGAAGTSTVSVEDVTEAMKDVVDPELDGHFAACLALIADFEADTRRSLRERGRLAAA